MMRSACWLLMAAVIAVGRCLDPNEFPSPCNSTIYCHGDLLRVVQMSGIHNDSKKFVDMAMLRDPDEVRSEFDIMMNRTSSSPSRDDVRQFVAENFGPPGSELENWLPTDWVPEPKILAKIKDVGLRSWISDLNGAWKKLGRRVAGDVYLHPERFSLIYVPNPTIVPGGRFREFYYWDSYWVVKGLLLSEMTDTVRGMLVNFLSMVKRFGFVPNGGRVYYNKRSQPPYLIPMVKLYMDATNDTQFLRSNIEYLEREYEFWRVNRSVEVEKNGVKYTMYRYNVEVGEPRPESYREDYELANSTQRTEADRQLLYAELKTAAESGWDFSSRWFRPNNGETGSLKDLKIRDIVPVDLNSLMFLNAALLAEFHKLLGNEDRTRHYSALAERQRTNLHLVLWDEEMGAWFDWDVTAQKLNKQFYPSNIFPIWVKASKNEQNVRFLDYLKESNATSAVSGVPTSLVASGQQWDHPNGWPPLQHVMVEALNLVNLPASRRLAFQLAQNWISTNYISYQESSPHAMFEKYNVDRVGLPGGGGEYDVQLGFGWSNGVAMAFSDLYSDRLVAPPISSAATRPFGLWVWPTLLILAIALLFTQSLL